VSAAAHAGAAGSIEKQDHADDSCHAAVEQEPRCSLCGDTADWCDCYASVLSVIDDYAADYPLEALRQFAEWLKPWRLDACATCEPAAALLYAEHLLTPDRRSYCIEAAKAAGLNRFVPDRLERERREAIRKRLAGLR
jgi:hypothetical protein